MQPVVETLDGLERRIEVSVAMADVEKRVKEELKKVARTAKAPGFRPGKVPMSMLERSHGPGIRYDVVNREVGRVLDESLAATGLRVAGAPSLEPKTDDVAQDTLAFKATFEVYPEIELPDLASVEVTKSVCKVTDAEVERTVNILREQRAEYVAEADRAAQDNDQVKIDFLGKIDDVAFEGGTAEDFPFVVGKGRMLTEFEDAVRGMKAGDTKTFPLTFPEDYPGKEVAGKTAQFTVTVKEVGRPELPEVNEEFAKSLGQAEGSVEKLMADIRQNIEREVESRLQARTKDSVMKAMLDRATFEVPKALVNGEVENRIAAAREQLKQRGVPNADSVPIPPETFSEEAQRRVKLGLMIGELINKNNLQAKPEQVRAKIETFAQNYEQPAQVVSYYLSDRQRRAEIEAVVLEDNVVEHVLAGAKVTEQAVPFEELMGQSA
ncbi:trigger factor [Orrella daihaiensis]|uniref:Trigger factor n=1 Tax=Orrella daihaiensis TaxID=2782176 RepID=A0ABY4AGS3_9BURK|nr:trigger factor [Orrella daihaiensis]UOD49268.1 trigger factor [Orrella daihaiensis]